MKIIIIIKQDTNTQNQNKDSTKKNNTQNQVPQTQKLVLDPKAEEMLKNYEKNIPLKAYTYNDEVLHLPLRYKPGEIIGVGAYGIIISAVDTQNKLFGIINNIENVNYWNS